MNGHHLVLGKLSDYVSGQTLDDTLDERHRQKIGRLLVEQKGYPKQALTSRHGLRIQLGQKCAQILITYTVTIADRITLLIQYGPGSLVTRHRPTLAMSRLVTGYQVPRVVVTNGEQADTLDGGSGGLLNTGLENIPSYEDLVALKTKHAWTAIDRERAQMETRILMAFEVDDRCPCDDSTCRIS